MWEGSVLVFLRACYGFVMLVGGLVMAAAGVGPKEAKSNLAQWATELGVKTVPNSLSTNAADNWGLLVGAALFLVAVILMICSFRKRPPQIDHSLPAAVAPPEYLPTPAKGKIDQIPIAFRVPHSQSAGRAYLHDDADADPLVVNFGDIEITNTSAKHNVSLNIELHITSTSDSTDITLPASDRSSLGLRLSRHGLANKIYAKHDMDELVYFDNPTEIEPQKTVKKRLVFLNEIPIEADRIDFLWRKRRDYIYKIIVKDLVSGYVVDVDVPGEYRGNPDGPR
jgi:hypothetical protein